MLQRYEHLREYSLIGLYQAVLRVSNIEGYTAVIGIDNRLDTVANIVQPSPKRLRIGVTVSSRIGVLYPG